MHVRAEHLTGASATEKRLAWITLNEARLFTVVSFLLAEADKDAALAVVEDSILQVFTEAERCSGKPPAPGQVVLAVASAGMKRLRDARPRHSGAPPLPPLQKPLERALWALPDELRCPLVLHDMCNLSYEQIADLMGQTHKTIGKRISAARSALLLAGANGSRHAGKVG